MTILEAPAADIRPADASVFDAHAIDPASIGLPPTHSVDVTEYLEALLGRL